MNRFIYSAILILWVFASNEGSVAFASSPVKSSGSASSSASGGSSDQIDLPADALHIGLDLDFSLFGVETIVEGQPVFLEANFSYLFSLGHPVVDVRMACSGMSSEIGWTRGLPVQVNPQTGAYRVSLTLEQLLSPIQCNPAYLFLFFRSTDSDATMSVSFKVFFNQLTAAEVDMHISKIEFYILNHSGGSGSWVGNGMGSAQNSQSGYQTFSAATDDGQSTSAAPLCSLSAEAQPPEFFTGLFWFSLLGVFSLLLLHSRKMKT